MKTILDILATDDAHRETVHVPLWDADIVVFSMTATERAEIERHWSDKKPSEDPCGFRQAVLSKSLKNEDGSPFGTDEQFAQLMHKNASAIEVLFEAACRVNGFSNSDVEQLGKN